MEPIGAPYFSTRVSAASARRASLWPSSTACGMMTSSPSMATRSPAATSRRATRMLSSGCRSSSGARRKASSFIAGSLRRWGFRRCGRRSGGFGGGLCVGGDIVGELGFELRGLVRHIAVAHLEFASLQPGVADESVLVVTLRELRIEVEQSRAHVDDFDGADSQTRVQIVVVVHRVRVLVRDATDRITQSSGAEQGQHDVRARLHAPLAEGLAEVFVVVLEAGGRG